MKAMVIKHFGGPDVFELADAAMPSLLNEHDVLIKVMATSVNPIDCKIRSGATGAFANPFPAILHGDVAGVIAGVGSAVTQFQPGDEVFACAGGVKGTGGALAEYMLADASLVAHKPKSLTMEQSAALPLVSITAWQSLIDKAGIKPGVSILIHAAAGGVGHIAIQLAKYFGAKVYATASGDEKLAIAKTLGADVGINYKMQSIEEYVAQLTDGKGFDIVMDTVGGDNLKGSFQAVANNGQVVCIQARSIQDLTPLHAKSVSLHVVFIMIPLLTGEGRQHHGVILTETARIVDEGKLRPLIDEHVFPFTEVSQAHRLLESGKAVGKVVLTNNL